MGEEDVDELAVVLGEEVDAGVVVGVDVEQEEGEGVELHQIVGGQLAQGSQYLYGRHHHQQEHRICNIEERLTYSKEAVTGCLWWGAGRDRGACGGAQ